MNPLIFGPLALPLAIDTVGALKREIVHMAFVAAGLYSENNDRKRKQTSREMDRSLYAIYKEVQENKGAKRGDDD